MLPILNSLLAVEHLTKVFGLLAVNQHSLLIFSDNNPFAASHRQSKKKSSFLGVLQNMGRMRWFLESSTQSYLYILTTEKVMLVTIFKIDIGSLIVQDCVFGLQQIGARQAVNQGGGEDGPSSARTLPPAHHLELSWPPSS